jgi:hypothetical protein
MVMPDDRMDHLPDSQEEQTMATDLENFVAWWVEPLKRLYRDTFPRCL